jgi:hypothetical protein
MEGNFQRPFQYSFLLPDPASPALPIPCPTLPALCMIFMILISLENVKKYSHVVARLPQRLKSMLFDNFLNGAPFVQKNFKQR